MTDTTASPALLYLLPRYDPESPEHVYHLYGFLKKLQKRVPLEILVERSAGALPADLPMRALRITRPVFRLVEEFVRILSARRRGIRTFYVHYSYTGAIAAALVARLFGGRVFYWNCSLYKELRLPASAPGMERLRQRLQERLLETSIRMSTHLVTGTPRVAEYYARHVGIPLSKIRLLPNFTDVARFQTVTRAKARRKLGLDPNQKVVLFLHRVAPRKGAHFLPEIAQRVLAKTAAVFLVAGGGPYLTELKIGVERDGLAESFDFRGWVPNRDVPLYFRAADLYVMPSQEEGFPRVLLETMAAGCPFVAFDVGGVRDILPKALNECVVERGNARAFSEKCAQALKDAGLRGKWAASGEQQAPLFSEDRVLEAFLRMIAGQALEWTAFLAPGGIKL
jgi:glycosyltransferase involved in cell wall biosynthesis